MIEHLTLGVAELARGAPRALDRDGHKNEAVCYNPNAADESAG